MDTSGGKVCCYLWHVLSGDWNISMWNISISPSTAASCLLTITPTSSEFQKQMSQQAMWNLYNTNTLDFLSKPGGCGVQDQVTGKFRILLGTWKNVPGYCVLQRGVMTCVFMAEGQEGQRLSNPSLMRTKIPLMREEEPSWPKKFLMVLF